MDRQTKNLRRKELRHHHESRIRKAEFVSEYVQHKYEAIYHEAEKLYESLRKQYPSKNDVRKTLEYAVWKNSINSQPSTEKEINPQPSTQKEINPQPSTEKEINPQPSTQKEINPQPSTEKEINPQPSTQKETNKNTYTDRLQLQISLINYKPSTQDPKTSTLIEDPLMNFPQEYDLQPSIIEEIPYDQLQEIINEITLDPCLEKIFNGSFDDLDMDIDIDFDLDDKFLY